MFRQIFIASTVLLLANQSSIDINAGELTPNEQAQEIIKLNDKNNDSKLSVDEVDTSFRLRRFRKVDKNADGYLDEAELAESYSNAAKAKKEREAKGEPKSPIKQIIETINPKPPTIKTLQDSGQRYKVEPGDSIYRIAKKYNVSESDLLLINKLEDASKLPMNKVLIIPASN
jgi:LysM repeat protein